jgi:hypothetical protein
MRKASRRNVIYGALAAVLTGAISFGIVYAGFSAFQKKMTPMLLDWLLINLSEEERQQLVQEAAAANTAALFDAAPEPLVGRIGMRNLVTTDDRAEIRFNNAGMRSAKPYRPKSRNVFRIVCLGDSMVFGHAGREEDRFCDQMEQFYRERRITVAGKRIELYAVGLDSWTMVQEATYLSSRISDYDPDVIVVLTTPNDITDVEGVSGGGRPTRMFSPEHRSRGSAVFTHSEGARFGVVGPSVLTTDLSPEARARWRKSMSALGRLVELQHRRGKRILLAVLELYGTYFTEIYKSYIHALEIDAPYVVTNYFPSRETRLVHDGHPNRLGHSIYMAHFVRLLDALGWVSIPEGQRPDLHEGLTLDISPPPDPARLAQDRRRYADEVLETSLDFDHLERSDTRSFLGGILSQRQWQAAAAALENPLWGTVRTGFLLKRPPDRDPAAVTIDLEIPPLVELFPLQIELHVNGQLMQMFAFDEPADSRRYTLRAGVPPLADDDLAIEVLLETDSYFTGVGDFRMKSFRLLSAEVR